MQYIDENGEDTMKRIVRICMLMALLISVFSVSADAKELGIASTPAVTESGQYGSSEWKLYDNGVLEIGTGTFVDNGNPISPWDAYSADIVMIKFTGTVIAARESTGLFCGLEELEDIVGIEYLDTSQVEYMDYMFWRCSNMTALDLSSWDVSNVERMTSMFLSCSSLRSLNLSTWDTNKRPQMSSMLHSQFGYCTIETLNLGEKFFVTTDSYLQPIDTSSGRYTGRWIGLHTKNAFDSSQSFTGSYTIKSIADTYVWEATYEVEFEENGASETIAGQQITTTNSATKPLSITKSGYNFMGWYTDSAFTLLWDFDTRVTTDMTLYAKWQEESGGSSGGVDPGVSTHRIYYVSTGHTHGEVPIDLNSYKNGDHITILPSTLGKDGYHLKGWRYEDTSVKMRLASVVNDLYQPGDVIIMGEKTTNLVAVWEIDDSTPGEEKPEEKTTTNDIEPQGKPSTSDVDPEEKQPLTGKGPKVESSGTVSGSKSNAPNTGVATKELAILLLAVGSLIVITFNLKNSKKEI